MDVSALDAIDVHTHVHRSVTAAPEPGHALEAMAAYFKTGAAAYTVDELAQYYRDRNMAAVTFTVDVKDRPDPETRVSSEEIAERAAANADVIIPFASVDPARRAPTARSIAPPMPPPVMPGTDQLARSPFAPTW